MILYRSLANLMVLLNVDCPVLKQYFTKNLPELSECGTVIKIVSPLDNSRIHLGGGGEARKTLSAGVRTQRRG